MACSHERLQGSLRRTRCLQCRAKERTDFQVSVYEWSRMRMSVHNWPICLAAVSTTLSVTPFAQGGSPSYSQMYNSLSPGQA